MVENDTRVPLKGTNPSPDSSQPAPDMRTDETGQHLDYWVLSDEERAKGFVRPVRDAYVHVGTKPQYPTRELTEDEHERFDRFGYVLYEAYPEGSNPVGQYWTKARLEGGCQTETKMGQAIAETYARNPTFYGSTFCVNCGGHFPVGEHGEFVWSGSNERVGT